MKNYGPMLYAYPDSMGNHLSGTVEILNMQEFKGIFQSFYILPSMYQNDLDRGFCVVRYDLDERVATEKDLSDLRSMNIDLMMDFVVNHASTGSPQFQDIVKNGSRSKFKDFFINWNQFWEGHGELDQEGILRPFSSAIEMMYFRGPGLPVLMIECDTGEKIPYWSTFYKQFTEKTKENGEIRRIYQAQMDLNIQSPMVWDYYQDAINHFSSYGAGLIRLDAFGHVSKIPGRVNFMNEPETWDILERIKALADPNGLEMIQEIHDCYAERTYFKLAEHGYRIYDFFLPALVIDAFIRNDGSIIRCWGEEIIRNKYQTVNLLCSHDGIPVYDALGLLDRKQIDEVAKLISSNGGEIRYLPAKKDIPYNIGTTLYSALGENDDNLLLARAIQLFMPGVPQIWYLDIFAGPNDYDAAKMGGATGNKEICRTNLSKDQIGQYLKKKVVVDQIKLLRFRSEFPAFARDAEIHIESAGYEMSFVWKKQDYKASLHLNLLTRRFSIEGLAPDGAVSFRYDS